MLKSNRKHDSFAHSYTEHTLMACEEIIPLRSKIFSNAKDCDIWSLWVWWTDDAEIHVYNLCVCIQLMSIRFWQTSHGRGQHRNGTVKQSPCTGCRVNANYERNTWCGRTLFRSPGSLSLIEKTFCYRTSGQRVNHSARPIRQETDWHQLNGITRLSQQQA